MVPKAGIILSNFLWIFMGKTAIDVINLQNRKQNLYKFLT